MSEKLISVKEATEIILSCSTPSNWVIKPFEETVNNILAEDIRADRDFPPFNRVSMDGIAINYDSFAQGQRTFSISRLHAAGDPFFLHEDPSSAVEIMTGAIMPGNLDTVVRYEDISIVDDQATIQIEMLKAGQNVHLKGLDQKEGDLLIKAGSPISPAEINVAASVGKARLRVYEAPKVAIISTGNELVNVNEKPLIHQIRRSNVYATAAALRRFGVKYQLFHIFDEEEQVRRYVLHALENFDAVILSGGVSKGKKDFLPAVLENLRVECLFHMVEQRPGKPFWFGKNRNGTVVFALPGNPVSSFVGTYRYVIPWLRSTLSLNPFPGHKAQLTEPFTFKPKLQYFLSVKTEIGPEGNVLATPVKGKGSGDLANLLQADGFLELAAHRSNFKKGSIFPYFPFREW